MNARRGRQAMTAVALSSLLCGAASAKLVGGEVERRPATDPEAEVRKLAKSPETVWLAWTVPARGDQTICGFGHGREGRGGWGMTLEDDDASWGSRDDAPPIAVARVELYAAVRGGSVQQLGDDRPPQLLLRLAGGRQPQALGERLGGLAAERRDQLPVDREPRRHRRRQRGFRDGVEGFRLGDHHANLRTSVAGAEPEAGTHPARESRGVPARGGPEQCQVVQGRAVCLRAGVGVHRTPPMRRDGLVGRRAALAKARIASPVARMLPRNAERSA